MVGASLGTRNVDSVGATSVPCVLSPGLGRVNGKNTEQTSRSGVLKVPIEGLYVSSSPDR